VFCRIGLHVDARVDVLQAGGRRFDPGTLHRRRTPAKRGCSFREQATVQEEDRQNEQLLILSQQILELTKEIHSSTNSQVPRRPS
jgi:hypothetical protein